MLNLPHTETVGTQPSEFHLYFLPQLEQTPTDLNLKTISTKWPPAFDKSKTFIWAGDSIFQQLESVFGDIPEVMTVSKNIDIIMQESESDSQLEQSEWEVFDFYTKLYESERFVHSSIYVVSLDFGFCLQCLIRSRWTWKYSPKVNKLFSSTTRQKLTDFCKNFSDSNTKNYRVFFLALGS